MDLPDGYDADAPGAIAVYDLWARRNSCDADNVSDACESGDEDWVTKYIPESKKDDEDVVVEDAPGARDTTVYEASQCAEGGGATLLVVDQCGSRLMGHGLFHNLAYLEATTPASGCSDAAAMRWTGRGDAMATTGRGDAMATTGRGDAAATTRIFGGRSRRRRGDDVDRRRTRRRTGDPQLDRTT